MAHFLRLTLLALLAVAFVGCATQPTPSAQTAATRHRIPKVRTTAYTHTEGTGNKNAVGQRLAAGSVKSASSDWSRYPLGTRFRIVSSGEEYIIDDYGGALVGTKTIDLYKPTRLEMRRWGVRREDIEIVRWGSTEQSLNVLRQRRGVARVRKMIASLERKQQREPGAEPQAIHAP